MPIFHRIFAIAIISMALSPSYGFASRNAYRCNGCNPIQYEDAAVAPQEIGIRYVYDFINGNISKYQVSREPNGHGFSYYAEQLSINTAEQAYFDSAATAWNSNGSSLKSMAYVNVSPTFPGSSVVSPSASAYDIVRTSAMQNNITDWMQGAAITSPQSQFEQRIKDLINAIKQSPANIVFDESDTSQLTITFIFSNGHKVTFVIKKGSAVVMTDAVDGNNNTIPVSAGALNGRTYIFSGGDGHDMNRFRTHIEMLGATFDNICNGFIIACVTASGVQTCHSASKC